MRSIACLNFKGGSSKTTTALALAAALTHRLPKHQRILAVDCDPQCNLSAVLMDGKHAEAPTLTDVLLEEANIADAVRPTRLKGLDVLPACERLADCTMLLADEMGKERRLRMALRELSDAYTTVIVDASPALTLLSVNVLGAVDEVIVPLDPGVFSISGLGRLQETVDRVRHYLEHPDLTIVGLLLTRFANTKASRDLQAQLREVHGSLVFRTVIPASVRVEEAHSRNLSIIEWAPQSSVAKAYDELVTEVLRHGKPKNRHARKRRPRHDAA